MSHPTLKKIRQIVEELRAEGTASEELLKALADAESKFVDVGPQLAKVKKLVKELDRLTNKDTAVFLQDGVKPLIYINFDDSGYHRLSTMSVTTLARRGDKAQTFIRDLMDATFLTSESNPLLQDFLNACHEYAKVLGAVDLPTLDRLTEEVKVVSKEEFLSQLISALRTYEPAVWTGGNFVSLPRSESNVETFEERLLDTYVTNNEMPERLNRLVAYTATMARAEGPKQHNRLKAGVTEWLGLQAANPELVVSQDVLPVLTAVIVQDDPVTSRAVNAVAPLVEEEDTYARRARLARYVFINPKFQAGVASVTKPTGLMELIRSVVASDFTASEE